MLDNDTIAALATSPYGYSAISIIRISGYNSIYIIENIFHFLNKKKKRLINQSTHTIHLGYIKGYGEKIKKEIDKVMISIFKSPHSYTGENMIEIYCHGSQYIYQRILRLLVSNGIRIARPGEFTLRAFINKKLDLTQAEAISDLIKSENESCHNIFFQQVKGSLNKEIKKLKKKFLNLVSLLELELDFSEDNLICDNKKKIYYYLNEIKNKLKYLVESFSLGNAIKNGVNVVIIGNPNVGKSSFFNKVLKEDRSIVSPIKGTTRDFLEGTINIKGILFRFIDTAGLRKSDDPIEIIGIKKTMDKIDESHVIFYLFNACVKNTEQKIIFNEIRDFNMKYPKKIIFVLANKKDIYSFKDFCGISSIPYFFKISAINHIDIEKVIHVLSTVFINRIKKNKIIVTQIRHYESFHNSLKEILLSINNFNKGLSEDFIIIHIKNAMNFLYEITGEVTNEDILNNIFSKFCIGK
ncbi:tRNA uridine-5-carboxymethylaminomethyl(34) synthesis GTPase MnmE [Blattabacterium cuenoti]|uniref:tRNA uridine-5-carboxymethylaminomethyl(34) synthesis GTPase MnmE n=1 Tax=Blattabacterium cuenoti TaxID=1653831 RepID=UPI00163C2C63|nr:tRNA uridine-5-carboxymethylaminomethyl(34) synthesis GTPase MnmE [Blattabacterium cuenoti]